MHQELLRSCLLALSVLAAAALPAQEPASRPQTKATAPTLVATTAVSSADNYDPRTDWPWLAHFKEANAALPPLRPGEDRVVFMGDSITQGWKIEGPAGYFPGKPYLNRGISGQTTPQMVLRFRQDVIDLHPRAVVILAGINDIAGNTGPETLEQIEGNLMTMAELATAAHIKVVMCSLLPAFDFPWRPGLAPANKVIALNTWMKSYAAENGHIYVDYHTAMKDQRNGLPANLSHDGVHPLPAGYEVMTPLVQAGIDKALQP